MMNPKEESSSSPRKTTTTTTATATSTSTILRIMRMKPGESTSQTAEHEEESAMRLKLPNTNTNTKQISHPEDATTTAAPTATKALPSSSTSLSSTTLSQEHEANVEAFLSQSLQILSLSSSSTSSWRRTTHPNMQQNNSQQGSQNTRRTTTTLPEATAISSPRPRRRRRRCDATSLKPSSSLRSVHWGVAHIYTLPKHHPRTSSSLAQEAEEKSRLWWQSDDYQQFANNNLSLLERFTNNQEKDNNEEEDCWRGLESLTPTEIQRRQVLRNAALDAVLEEQDVQYERDGRITPVPHGISRVYVPFSKRALQLAHKKAQEDTQSVLRMMRKGQGDHETSPTIRRKNATTMTTSDSSSNSHHHRRVQVHFHKTVQVQTGLHREDYTFQETKDVWYSSQEILQLKGTCQQVIRAYKKKKKTTNQQSSLSATSTTMVHSTEEISMRGLEPYLIMSRHDHEQEGEKRLTARRYNVHGMWNTVLDEQERLEAAASADKDHHSSIALALARVSQEASRACTKWALKLAQKDARFLLESGYCTQELQDYSIQSLQPYEQRQHQEQLSPATTHQATPPKKTCDLMSAATVSTCSSSSESSSSLGSPDAPVSYQGMLRAESTSATAQAPTKDATAIKTKNLMIGSSLDFIRDSLTFLGPPLPAALDDSTQDTRTKRRQQVLSSQMKEPETILANGDEDEQLPVLSLSAYSTDDSSSLLESDDDDDDDEQGGGNIDDGIHDHDDNITLPQASFQALKALSSSSSNPPTLA